LPPLKDIIKQLLNEVKAALKEYFQETEDALKQRLKKMLIFSVASAIMLTLITTFVGGASLFFLIGSLRYLETTMPAWQAWYIIGGTSASIAAAIIIALILIIYRQFRSSKKQQMQNQASESSKTA
jgi:integral membrane sensor domain MASE1